MLCKYTDTGGMDQTDNDDDEEDKIGYVFFSAAFMTK